MDIPTFRAQFPAFADSSAYTDQLITIWYGFAQQYLSEGWALNGARYDLAVQLMTAHLIILAYPTPPGLTGAAAGTGGAQIAGGPITGATEGGVSVTIAPPPVKTAWQQWLAGTQYGLQLWALLRIAAAGGLYVGGLNERQAFRRAGGAQF
jgi:hypothetical protein